jgi:hypothetical protein
MRAFGAARALAARRSVAPRCVALATVGGRSFSTPHAANPNTFVSSHSQALAAHEPHELAGFLRRKELVFKETDAHFVVRECPFCHPTRGRPDNLFKLYVHRTKGVYKCHRCGAAGSWLDFKTKVSEDVFATVCRCTLELTRDASDSCNRTSPLRPRPPAASLRPTVLARRWRTSTRSRSSTRWTTARPWVSSRT